MPGSAIEDVFDMAVEHHQAGALAEAEPLYRRLVDAEPRHSDALHLLGVLCFQTGRPDAALGLIARAIGVKPAAAYYGNIGLVLAAQKKLDHAIAAYRKAIELNPKFAEAHNNLGGALRQTGRIDQAIGAYGQAISLKPDFAEAHNNLALALADQGKIGGAVAGFNRAIALRPNYAEAHNNLGNALLGAGQTAAAVACWRQALRLNPKLAEAHNNLGNALKQAGQTEQAIEAFQQALALQPNLPEAHNNLGVILEGQGKFAEATACYRRALAHRPAYADAYYNLAIALHRDGDLPGAVRACRKAITLKPHWPAACNNLGIWLGETGETEGALTSFELALAAAPDYAAAHSNRGNVFRQLGRLNSAIDSYRKAVALRPDYAEAWSNLGASLKQAGKMEDATAAFERALTLQPELAEAHNNLGNVLKDQGLLNEAMARYERAVELSPGDAAIDSNRVYTLHFHPHYSADAILEEHRRWTARHADPLRQHIRPHDNAPFPRRKLKIGYISPDFRDHCQAMFTVPLLANHDRDRFEISCYADVSAPDAITERLRSYADNWQNIAGASDDRVAEQIRLDRIDILVDLSVHMAHNRLLTMARKPAPVQATWLGYPGTTGMSVIDYRLSDPYLDPPGSDRFYAEQTLRLPETFWCYDALTTEPEANPLPALESGHVTFGCLNNFCKVNDAVLKLWAGAMLATPYSTLLLLAPEGAARKHVLAALENEKIDPARVQFVNRQSRGKYLEIYHRIDIGLDTFPYNGHTTSLDAYWMGVPVVTRIGATAVGRGGWSQLSNLGMTELAASSDEHFIRIAASLAGDLTRLRQLRANLRGRLMRSPLCDAPRFARNVENAYRAMWQIWSDQRRQPSSRDGITLTIHPVGKPRRMVRTRQAS